MTARDLCRKHYNRWRKGIPIDAPVAKRDVAGCSIPSCDRLVDIFASGLCNSHYQRLQKYGDVMAHKPVINRTRGFYIDSDGYVIVKGVGQHRRVMADHLRRELLGHETVHHKNGNRADNRLDNLELWSSMQPRGQRISDKIQYALEIIEIYGHNPSIYE